MYATGLLQNLHAGAEVEVVGVGQDDLGFGFLFHVAVEKSFDGGRRTYGHENRGLNYTVVGLNLACSRLRIGRRMLYGKC